MLNIVDEMQKSDDPEMKVCENADPVFVPKHTCLIFGISFSLTHVAVCLQIAVCTGAFPPVVFE